MANVKDDEFETLEFANESEYIGTDGEADEPAHCSRCHEVGSFADLEYNSGVCERCMFLADA